MSNIFSVGCCHRFLVIALFILLLQGCQQSENQKAIDNRPNIVLIMADDMGYSDIGAYGGEIDTPHLNKDPISMVLIVFSAFLKVVAYIFIP